MCVPLQSFSAMPNYEVFICTLLYINLYTMPLNCTSDSVKHYVNVLFFTCQTFHRSTSIYAVVITIMLPLCIRTENSYSHVMQPLNAAEC